MRIFYKTFLGLICLFSTAYADDINLFRIGIGGLYGSYTSDAGGNDFKNIGGYVNITGRSFINTTRNFITEGGGDIAFGKNSNQIDSGALYMYEGFFNVGYNLATQNYPLYLKLEYAYGTFAEEIQDNATALRTSLHQIGGVLHGFIHTQGKMTYEYALGYYYVFYGYHYFYPNNQDSGIRSSINDYTYALKAHIGFTYNFTERFGVFMNLKARYYDIAKSHRNTTFDYPKAQNLVGMLELGLQF